MQQTGCFDRFFMALALAVAAAMMVGVAVLQTNRVGAQEPDYQRYLNGTLYLINPVAQVQRYTLLTVPYIQDGMLCAKVDQYQVEMCAPLTNIAGIMEPTP